MRTGDVLENTYHLDGLLGESGMGLVFDAHDATGRRFAIKYILPHVASRSASVEAFLDEVRRAGALPSPHVAAVLDAGTTSGAAPYIVREYREGRDLAALLEAEGRLQPGRAVELLRQACAGLAAAHAQGISHWNLKPRNLFLTAHPAGERLEVLDFGIARLRESLAEEASDATVSGAVIGMPYYVPIEQARADAARDHRVDVYALGVILFEALAGARPYEAESYTRLLVEIAMGRPRALRELRPAVSEELAAVVERAMAREPADRFATVDELSAALAPFAGLTLPDDAPKPVRRISLATGAPAATPAPGRAKRSRRRLLSIVAIAAVTLFALGAVGLALLLNRAPPAVLAAEDRAFVDDQQGRGWEERCYFHYTEQRLANARAACLKGLDVAREPAVKASLYYNLGRISIGQGDRRRARSYLEKSLELRPDFIAARQELEGLDR